MEYILEDFRLLYLETNDKEEALLNGSANAPYYGNVSPHRLLIPFINILNILVAEGFTFAWPIFQAVAKSVSVHACVFNFIY